MPAIRDWTVASTATTGTTLQTYLPAYQAGDLLLAICTAKSAGVATNWSLAGWTRIINQTNTSNLSVLWKIAGSSEVDPLFSSGLGSAVALGAHLISIQDVDTTTPINVSTVANTASTLRGTMPQVTTTRANALVLYTHMTNGALTPMVLEGPVIYEDGADYNTIGEGFSWTVKTSTGTTPNNVYWIDKGATVTAGVNAVIAINPPSSGATIVPAFCASDSSVFIDPIDGIDRFNNNSALASTAQTQFGTIINTLNLVNGTAAGATDVGLNSYRSMGQLTGTATANTYAGVTTVLAVENKPNVTGKNVLIHCKPATPKVLQNTDSIGRSKAAGIAIGMNSTAATAFKVWHVHGSNTTFDNAQHVPLVINSQNTSGLIQTTGSFNPSSVNAFGFFASGSVVAPVWQFGAIWSLDTTTICGGNTSAPVGILGIVKAASIGKERLSVLQQGANQMLVLQPLQIGNGVDKTYLNLDQSSIEFPNHYSKNQRQVFYCSANNVAGLSYYASANDTIIHTNSSIISQNKYFWGFNASTSVLATYDFTNTIIQGAGTITLSANVPLTTVTFSKCDQIPANGCTLTDCLFSDSSAGAGQGAVSITGNSQVALQAELDKLVACHFEDNSTPRGALRIIYTGSAAPIQLDCDSLVFTNNTTDLYWDAPAGSKLTFDQYDVSNVTTYYASNSNIVELRTISTYVQIDFDPNLVLDGADAKYFVYYKQINQNKVSCQFGKNNAVLVKSIVTDFAGDGSYDVRGTLAGSIDQVIFAYSFVDNDQAVWSANTPYKINDEFCVGTYDSRVWYKVTSNYTSGSSFTEILDGANTDIIDGPTIVLVALGKTNAQYFSIEATINEATTTEISSINNKELNYSA